MNRVFIIAEAGVNHNGSLKMARHLVDVAVKSGADAVKFQTFRAEAVVVPTLEKAKYQIKNMGTSEPQLEMLKKLELSTKAHGELVKYCKKKGIVFLSSPFDLKSVDLLHRLGLKIFKIPSGEITNLPYLRKIGRLRKKIIISTGMSNLEEIKTALSILTKAGVVKKDITVLHCNTEYPTPLEDANLSAMLTIRDVLKVNAGYSDHTLGTEVSIAAAALGARVIEKHFTLDRNMEGPDHRTSLEPEELAAMIKAIRNIEKSMGDGVKDASPSERKNKLIVRKSIVAFMDIKKGELFTEENLTVKRPGTGINPMEWYKIIGKSAKRNYLKEEPIEL